MDEADRAQQDQEFYARIQQTKPKKEAEPTGYCLFCGEEILDKQRRWCDVSCRDAWEKEHKRQLYRSR